MHHKAYLHICLILFYLGSPPFFSFIPFHNLQKHWGGKYFTITRSWYNGVALWRRDGEGSIVTYVRETHGLPGE